MSEHLEANAPSPENRKLFSNGLFRTSLMSTVLAFLACLSTHVITILGLAGALYKSTSIATEKLFQYVRHRT